MKPVIRQVPLPVLPDDILSKIGDAWIVNRNNEALKATKGVFGVHTELQWALKEALKDSDELNRATSSRVAYGLKKALYDPKNIYQGNWPTPRPVIKMSRGNKITTRKIKKRRVDYT